MKADRMGLAMTAILFVALPWVVAGCVAADATPGPLRGTVEPAFSPGALLLGAADTPGPVSTAAASPAPPIPRPAITPTHPPSSAAANGYATLTALTPPVPLTLDLARPREAAAGVEFLGGLPPQAYDPAWSPDGSLLAYVRPAAGWDVIEVYRPADSMLVARWALLPSVGQLIWAPDGQRIAFLRDIQPVDPKGGEIGYDEVAFVRLGDADSHVLVKRTDSRAWLDQWLDDETLIYGTSCGTGCRDMATINTGSGGVTRLNSRWDNPGDPIYDGARYLFNADRRWLAVTDIMLFPRTLVGPGERWQDPAGMAPLAAGLHTRFTDPEFWSGHLLTFLAYPPGDREGWGAYIKRDLYVRDMETGELRLLARGARAASLDPTGNCVALVLDGPPETDSGGVVSATVSTPYLALLSWPQWQLLGGGPARSAVVDSGSIWDVPTTLWSRDGRRLLYPTRENSWAWMDREARTAPVIAGGYAEWAGWGANGVLAVVVDRRIWLVRVP